MKAFGYKKKLRFTFMIYSFGGILQLANRKSKIVNMD